MTRVPVLAVAYALTLLALTMGAALGADQPRTEKFELILSTRVDLLPFELPPLPNIPGLNIADWPDPTAPQRNIEAEAFYRDPAVPPVFVTVPRDLGLPNDRLELQVFNSTLAPETQDEEIPPPTEGALRMDLTNKIYWHPDVAQGPVAQEVHLDTDQLRQQAGAAALQAAFMQMGAMAERVAAGSSSDVSETAVGRGSYVLNTGGTALLDGFLPPLRVTSPKSMQTLKPEEGIEVVWEPVAGARGYILHAFGTTGQGTNNWTIITWVSTLREPPERVRSGYEQETSIADDLANGILLPPQTTRCKVPAGIFVNTDMFSLTLTAVGNDFFSTADGITVRGKIRSEWAGTKMSALLDPVGMGTMLPGLGAFDMPQDEQPEEDVQHEPQDQGADG